MNDSYNSVFKVQYGRSNTQTSCWWYSWGNKSLTASENQPITAVEQLKIWKLITVLTWLSLVDYHRADIAVVGGLPCSTTVDYVSEVTMQQSYWCVRRSTVSLSGESYSVCELRHFTLSVSSQYHTGFAA